MLTSWPINFTFLSIVVFTQARRAVSNNFPTCHTPKKPSLDFTHQRALLTAVYDLVGQFVTSYQIWVWQVWPEMLKKKKEKKKKGRRCPASAELLCYRGLLWWFRSERSTRRKEKEKKNDSTVSWLILSSVWCGLPLCKKSNIVAPNKQRWLNKTLYWCDCFLELCQPMKIM